MKIRIERPTGVSYDVDQHNIVVAFHYPVSVVQDGRTPAFVKVGERQPFTELASDLLETTAEFCGALVKKARKLQRIGIVVNVRLPPDALPPGVEQFLKHLGRPWGKTPQGVIARITAGLDDDDLCHHQIQWNEEGDVMQLTLDWQRYFRPTREADAKTTQKLTAEAAKDALAYFDRFGEGDLDYACD